MKWSLTLLLALTAAAVLSVVAMVSRQKLLPPHETLEIVKRGLASGDLDPQACLRRLDSALRRAETLEVVREGVADLCAELHLERGDILRGIGANEDARREYQLVLDRYRPGDFAVRLLLVQTDIAGGDLIGALGRLESLLEDQPDYGPAWVAKGRMHLSLAHVALESCEERARRLLPTADAERVVELIERLAALDAADSARTPAILEVRQLFPVSEEEELAQTLELCDVASEEMTEARAAFVESFSHGMDPASVAGYLEILVPAERIQEAVRFGTLAMHLSERLGRAAVDEEAGALLVRALADRGDWNRAGDLAARWLEGDALLDAEFLRTICLVLYQSRRWQFMGQAVNALRQIGTADDEALTNLYLGLATASLPSGDKARALLSLTQFARSLVGDPFPDARAIAWREISRIHRERGDLALEREAIQAVVELAPDLDGELWLRRAEIQMEARHSGYLLPLHSWAKAMSLLPQRTDELMEQFVALGERALAAQDRSIDLLERELDESGRTLPTRDYDPYSLYRLAQGRGQRGNYRGQAALAERILRDLPGFLPALDELIEARLGLGSRREFVDLVVERVELAGLDGRCRELLALIDDSELAPSQVLRLMIVDSRGRGRSTVARWLHERGETDEALRTLRSGPIDQRTDEERLLGSELMMELGDYSGALAWLDEIEPEGLLAPAKRRRSLTCALELGDDVHLRKALTSLVSGRAAPPEELWRVSDLLLSHGRPQLALGVLGGPGEEASGPDLFRRAAIATFTGDLVEARELLDRAEPFIDEDQAGALRLVLESRRDDWLGCERTASRLLDSPRGDRPRRTALLELLSGHPEEARGTAEFGAELTPEILEWSLVSAAASLLLDEPISIPADFGSRAAAQTELFLRGAPEAGEAPADPRRSAALLLALEVPELSPLVLAELSSMAPGTRGRLWPGLLSASLLERSGRRAEASRELAVLTTTFPDSRALWNRLEDAYLAMLPSPDHPRLAALREDRLWALARTVPGCVEGAVLRARAAAEGGDLPEALRLATSSVEQSGGWWVAHLEEARILSAMRNWEPALQSWRRLVLAPSGPGARLGIGGLVELLEAARRAAPPGLDERTVVETLKEVADAHPGDPRPPLALARIDVRSDPLNPSIGIERAWARLSAFRQQHEGVPIELLQRGATGDWARFYVEVDPTAAEGFIESELERLPGNIELWGLLGRVRRELGELRESALVLTRAARMADDPALQLELARTFLASGAEPRLVATPLDAALRLTREPETLDSRLLRAASLLDQLDGSTWPTALAVLEPLWEERAPSTPTPERARLAELYARALLLRSEDADFQRALDVLEEGLEVAAAPYQREQFQALRGLALAVQPAMP